MRFLRLQFRLLEPVVAGAAGGDANTVETYPYLPGSSLRGAAIGRAEAASPFGQRLLFTDDVVFLNAYPAVYLNGRYVRALPTPLAWRQPKTGGNQSPRMVMDDAPADAVDTKGVSGFFAGQPAARHVEVASLLSVHHQRHRGLGRAVKDSPDERNPGAIFRFTSLASGQRFIGVVISADLAAIAGVREAFEQGPIRLGKSRSSYGRVEIEQVCVLDRWDEAVDEGSAVAGQGGRANASGSPFTVTLLSPGYFRDSSGTASLQPDLAEISSLLGVPADSLSIVGRAAGAEAAGGFNRKWNLPLPTVQTVRSGSAFRIVCREPIESFERLVERGLGDRQCDGFGRVAVNLPLPTSLQAATDDEPPDREPPLRPENHALAATLARRMFAQRLEDFLQAEVQLWQFAGGSAPSRSTLSRLRAIVTRAIEEQKSGDVDEALGRISGHTAEELRRAHVEGPGGRHDLGTWIAGSRVRYGDVLTAMQGTCAVGDVLPEVRADIIGLICVERTLGRLRRKLQEGA